MSLEELRFTDEEIDHAVREFRSAAGQGDAEAAIVRRVLRAVRAVPARCLNGHLAGIPAAQGSKVQGTGLGGRVVRGTVEVSYPITTTVHTPEGETDYLWTNTIRAWDPSTEALRKQVEAEMGMPVVLDPNVPRGQIFIGPPAILVDPHLVADDDGMAVEADR